MHFERFVQPFLHWSVLICLGYLLLVYAFMAFVMIIAAVESRTRKSEAKAEDYDALLNSRFTIPVSVIVPAHNEESMITTVVRCLLNFDYPEYEVIVVNDGSKDGTLNVLKRDFELAPVEVFYRKTLATKPVRAVYRSKTDSRLILIDKDNGGKADALNCGVDVARYPYLCCLDGDSVYNREALLEGMRLAVKDPATVVGVTSTIGVGRHPNSREGDELGLKSVDHHLWTNFQHLDLLRGFLSHRLAWSRLHIMLCASGAFAIWRRDVVLEMGGFSSNFSCEDIEMTFRVTERYLRERRPVKILSLPNMLCMTEGPEHVSALISQRARWQRVVLETVWHYRRMLLNPRYGTAAFLMMPYFVLSECVGPFMLVLATVSFILALAFQLLTWTQFLALVGIQVFALGIISSVSLGIYDWSFRDYRLRDLVRLIVIAPLDFFCYRPILMYAGVKGTIGFLRGEKQWHRFKRNVRPFSG